MYWLDDGRRTTAPEGAGCTEGIGVAIPVQRRRYSTEESDLFSEVVGAGNAAWTAALAAREAGAQVLVNNSYRTVRWMQSLGVGFELYQTAVRQGGRIYFPAGAVIQFWSGGPGLTHRLFRAIEPAKTNWALCLDKPPFVAYAVR